MKKSILYLVFIAFLSLFSGKVHAQAPGWLWAKIATGTNVDQGYSIATDASGNAYVTGSFSSHTITFGFITLTNLNAGNGNYDVFLVKYDSAGNVLWAKCAGGTHGAYGTSVAVDASGNVYLTGWYGSHTIIFDSITLTNAGQNDMFLVKYNAGGDVLWAKSIGGTDNDFGYSVATDASGDVYVTGYFESPAITIGSCTLTQTDSKNTGIYPVLLVKFNGIGIVQWATNAEGTGLGFGKSVAVDAEGNVYVTGYFLSTIIIFGSDTLTNAGTWDMFLVKYNESGIVLWAKSAGGAYQDGGLSVAVDALRDAYVTGFFKSPTISFGTYTLTNANTGRDDIFIAKYDSYGNVQWAKSAGGTDIDEGYSVAVDVSGNAYFTGFFGSPTISFGSYTLTNTGEYDIFLAKIDAGGIVRWAESLGGTSSDEGYSVAVDDAGNVYLTGMFFSPTIAFGSYSLTNTGKANMFLAKSKGWNAGINELDNSSDISVYPNPASGKIRIVLPAERTEGNLIIMNYEGMELLQQKVNGSPATIDVSNLPAGLYFVKIIGGQNMLVKKFIRK